MPAHDLITEADAFRAAIATWRHEPRLWIDTEVADWATKAPRLSLLQVRTRTGWNCVADVLNPAMRNVLDDEFIPQVMENDAVEKWAHYARSATLGRASCLCSRGHRVVLPGSWRAP
jgi:ribonuclease D